MREIIAVLVIVYLVGVGVVLAPTFENYWNTAPASKLAANVSIELPRALSWPATMYRRAAQRA